jgi:hypothetical protein
MDDFLTAEPAVVVPKDDDEMINGSSVSIEATASILNLADPEIDMTSPRISTRHQQHGALFRRTCTNNTITALNGLHRSRLDSISDTMLGDFALNNDIPVSERPCASTKRD